MSTGEAIYPFLYRKPSLWRHLVSFRKKAKLVKDFNHLVQNAEPVKAFHRSDSKAEEVKAGYPGPFNMFLKILNHMDWLLMIK